MTKIYWGENQGQKTAARIAFYNITKQVPVGQTPIVYDVPGQRVVYYPNGGYAAHYEIFDWMQDKGWDIPPLAGQAHGYYWPDSQRFGWNGGGYYMPNPNLEAAFRNGIAQSSPKPKEVPMPRLCKFEWAADGDEQVYNTESQRPVIYWVNTDTVYLGKPHGAHYQVYEVMEDDGFDSSASGGQEEVHGYFNYRGQHDLYWYDEGAYGYEVNRKPIGDEEIRIKATIFNALNIPWNSQTVSKVKRSSLLPLVVEETDDDHGGGVPWIWDGEEIHVGNREGFHYSLDSRREDVYGRFLPDTNQVLFYNRYNNPWTDLHDDIVETLRAHRDQIYAEGVEPTGLEQSNIAGQDWDDPRPGGFFQMVD